MVIEYLWRLGAGHFDRVYLLSWPATMELDQIPVEIPGQIRRAAAALALLTVPGSFFHAASITKIKKQRHRATLCAAVSLSKKSVLNQFYHIARQRALNRICFANS